MAEKRRATTFRTSKGTIVNVAAPTVYVSPAFLSTEDVTNPTEMSAVMREELQQKFLSVVTPRLGRARRFINNPIIDLGAPGSFDSTQAGDPRAFCLCRTTAAVRYRYGICYTGHDAADVRSIGLATSDDILGVWTKRGQILAGTPGTWDAAGVCKLALLPGRHLDGYRYWGFYSGLTSGGPDGRIGFVYGETLPNLIKYPTPIMSVGAAGAWDSVWVSNPAPRIRNVDGELYLYVYYEARQTVAGQEKVRIGLATKKLSEFLAGNRQLVKHPENPIVDLTFEASGYGAHQVGDPCIFSLGSVECLLVGLLPQEGDYTGQGTVALYSVDGVHFYHAPNVFLLPTTVPRRLGEWDGDSADDISVLKVPGMNELFVFYEGHGGVPVADRVGLARVPILDALVKMEELVIDVASIVAAGSATVTTYELDNAKVLSVTISVTYGGAATLGVRVWLLNSPNRTNFDSQNTTDAFTYFEPSFTAGATRQKTILLDAEGIKYLRIVVENLDAAVATGAVKVWTVEHVEAA